MDSINLLEDLGNNVKIEAESDSVFFGHSVISSTTLLPASTGRDRRDIQGGMAQGECFSASDMADLDFDILQDLPLPVDDFSLLDDILMNEESSSNSFSSESYGLDSIADSPPLTPPSPTCSSSSSSSQFGQAEIKVEPGSPDSGYTNGQADMVTDISQARPNIKSSRGRSASNEAPEVQALKRHIRMIRNRESACMSRKKKKDYVTGVESRVKELEAENMQLKQENALLKKRLQDLGQNTTAPPKVLIPATQMKTIPSVIPLPKIIKINGKLPVTAAKFVLLGVCCFMFVTFRPPIINDQFSNTTHPMSKIMINSDDIVPREFVPPLSRESSITYQSERHVDTDAEPEIIKGQRKRGLWDNIRVDENHLDKNESVNGTLSGIGNNTTPSSNKIHHRRLSNSPNAGSSEKQTYANETLDGKAWSNMEKCSLFNQTEAMRVQNRLKGIFGKRPDRTRRKHVHKPLVYSLIDSSTHTNNENKGLTVYDEKIRQYSKVFDQIERREDTFYVISLAIENQLLFSAKAHNVTSRPKMSFLLPWRNETRGGKEELMQIDCEVTGVSTLHKP